MMNSRKGTLPLLKELHKQAGDAQRTGDHCQQRFGKFCLQPAQQARSKPPVQARKKQSYDHEN